MWIKNIIRKIFLTVSFVLVFVTAGAEPYYTVDSLQIVAVINRDGSVDVTELVQYNAYEINGILYNIDYRGYGELENFAVYYEKNGVLIPAENNDSETKGTYILSDEDELASIKLYFPIREQRQTFFFNYTLTQGVTVYDDIAQFNRKMVGNGWESDVSNIEVTVILPDEAAEEKIYAFGHGPLTGNVKIVKGKEIVYTLDKYYSGEFVEADILFPKELVSDIAPELVKNEDGFEKIMKMEEKLAEQANRKREFAKHKKTFADIAFAATWGWILFVIFFAYFKNGKRYKVVNEYGEYFRELPDENTPAVAGAIVSRGRIKPQFLFATFMDLVRKDVFEMVEDKGKTLLQKREFNKKLLKNYEKFVVDWYIDKIGNGSEVSMEEIDEYISDRKNAKAFGRKYEKWEEMVEKALGKAGFKKEKRSNLPVYFAVGTAVLSIPVGVFSAITFDDMRFIMFIFISFFVAIFSSTRSRFTRQAEELYSRWKAFKKFLVDYSNLEEAKTAAIHLWEHYFVYAIALGVAEKVAEGYKKISPEFELLDADKIDRRMPLMYMHNRHRGFSRIEKTTSNAVKRSTAELAKSRSSSSSGRGGGFSSGSSGGGGSRGGGGAF